MEKIIDVKNLTVSFRTVNGKVHAVRDVDFYLNKGETLCIVGESGSGKSVTCRAILGILSSNGMIEKGSIMYRGMDLVKTKEKHFHKIRGSNIGMIFQDPLSSLNPVMRVGKQITEAVIINRRKFIHSQIKDNKNRISELNNSKEAWALILKLRQEKDKQETEIFDLKEELRIAKINISMLKKKKNNSANVETEEIKAQITKVRAKIKELKTAHRLEVKKLKQEFKTIKKQDDLKKVKFDKQEVNKIKSSNKLELSNFKAEYKQNLDKIKSEHEQKVSKLKEEIKRISSLEISKKEKETRLAVVSHELKECQYQHSKVIAEQKGLEKEFKTNLKIKVNRIKYGEEIAKLKAEILNLRKEYFNFYKMHKLAKEKALSLMKEVGIANYEKRFRHFPFQFSGGMRQRIVIAIALASNPEVLICDEPTTALDVTIQSQILELINQLKQERKLSVIFITHDLGVVANMADRVAIMYAGKIVEYGNVDEIFYNPQHPYTWALLSSMPSLITDNSKRLEAIPGTPPNMIYPPKGDAFALRNKYAMKIDLEEQPPFFKVSESHYAATWLLHENAPKVDRNKSNSNKEGKKNG